MIKESQFVSVKELGFDIRNQRDKKGLSQRAVAKHCGVSTVAYQAWENGITKFIKPQHYDKLQEILADEAQQI